MLLHLRDTIHRLIDEEIGTIMTRLADGSWSGEIEGKQLVYKIKGLRAARELVDKGHEKFETEDEEGDLNSDEDV